MAPELLNPHLAQLRWGLLGELALKIGDIAALNSAVVALRKQDSINVIAAMLEVKGAQQAGLDQNMVRERFREILTTIPGDIDMVTRYLFAEELYRQGLPTETAAFITDHVDLSRRSPMTVLYLQSLAGARRDDAFRKAISTAAPVVREDPDILWMAAIHAWNIGDLEAAYRSTEALLKHEPNNARARLLKIETLVRRDRSKELFEELDKRVEDLTWGQPQDRFRIASLLGHFGYIDRAAAFAYRLFLEHRDMSQAWMTLSTLVLEEGRGTNDGPRRWDVSLVQPNIAVDLRFDDGEERFLVVEPDARLRQLDEASLEPDHPLVRILAGQGKGERIIDSNGREATIIELRHKYVARLHYVMQRYQSRFPEICGFRQISMGNKGAGENDEFITELKARHEWIEQEHKQYLNGPWPLAVLAERLGNDTIDTALSLASGGIQLKVAIGNENERDAATRAVRDNDRKGCVLDLYSFWLAWQLQAFDAIGLICGPIYLPQSVMDNLRARREKINYSTKDGLRSARYEAGTIAIYEVPTDVVMGWRDDVDRAIKWAEANASICPQVAGDDLPPALREYLHIVRSDMFDSLILATQTGILLVTDDLPIRDLSRVVGGAGSAWLHRIFGMALEQKRINLDTFIRWSVHLIDAGHNFIGVSGLALARAFRLDAKTEAIPGSLFGTLSKIVGGRNAEPRSHVEACLECLRDLWSDGTTQVCCQKATGLLLEQLLRERHDDYRQILLAIFLGGRRLPGFAEYIVGWARGHFIVDPHGRKRHQTN
ncbi:MAG: hypothetical protein V4568_18540 [Pseudomonadota bacterium]